MSMIVTVLQVLLGLFFLASGGSKIAGAKVQVENFERWRLPQWFRSVVGVVEVIGALGLLAGVAVHWLASVAALWLAAVMVGALLTHTRVRDAAQNFAPAAVLLVIAVIVVALR